MIEQVLSLPTEFEDKQLVSMQCKPEPHRNNAEYDNDAHHLLPAWLLDVRLKVLVVLSH